MSIWTFKARILGVLGGITLSACGEISLPQMTWGGGAKAVTSAPLARGAVQLTAPDGYCIDRRSLSDSFALLGRCDTLGVVGAFNGRDLAIIAVSTLPVDDDTAGVDADGLASGDQDQVVDTVEADALTFVRVTSDEVPIEGVEPMYWRTAFVVNAQLVSLTLYAPPDSPALSRDGAWLLETASRATLQASQPTAG